MLTYTCEWTLGNIAIYAAGAVVAHLDDVDCTMVLDGDGELAMVRLPVDIITGRTAEIAPVVSYPKFPDTNAEEIWRAALNEMSIRGDEIREKAGVPRHTEGDAFEYTDRRLRPVAANLNISFRPF